MIRARSLSGPGRPLVSVLVSVLVGGLLLAALWASPAIGQKIVDADLPLRYLEALYELDLTALEQLTAPDMFFHDSTAIRLGGGAWRFEGRDAVLEFFRGSFEGVESTGFEVIRRFDTAEHAVLDLVYWTRMDGKLLGAPGVPLHLRVPAVTVIRTQDGRVVEHQDFVDYDSLLRQVEEQVGERPSGIRREPVGRHR